MVVIHVKNGQILNVLSNLNNLDVQIIDEDYLKKCGASQFQIDVLRNKLYQGLSEISYDMIEAVKI